MNKKLVIETEEDWQMLQQVIREQIRAHMKSMERRGFRVVRRMTDVPGYNNWQAALERCRNQKKESWQHYGGRGIRVCERWHDFGKFLEDMGEKPSPHHTLDRIDVNGDYEPSNCRWATWTEQMRNQRDSVHVTVNGVTKPLKEWAELTGLKYTTLYTRLVLWGWSPEEAIKTRRHGRWKRRANDRGRALVEGAVDSQGRERAPGAKAVSGAGEGEEQS